jgi:hypothetical protein
MDQVADARIGAYRAGSLTDSWTTDLAADGSYAFERMLPAGEFRVHVVPAGRATSIPFASATAKVDLGRVTVADLNVQGDATLVLVRPSTPRDSAARVRIARQGDSTQTELAAFSFSGAKLALRGLSPGRYVLRGTGQPEGTMVVLARGTVVEVTVE